MDRIKQLTTAALSQADGMGGSEFYELIALLVDAIDEMADAIDSEIYSPEEELFGTAELTN